jgi:hypothetical protein
MTAMAAFVREHCREYDVPEQAVRVAGGFLNDPCQWHI